jgi:cell division transport system ATP-binding protein
MIKFEKVTKVFPCRSKGIPTTALADVSFEIEKGEFVSIVGKSGAGKTTLLKLILAEEKPTKGKIFFEGKDIQKIKLKDLPRYRQKIGTVFQDYKLLSSKTTYKNVAYVMEVIGASEAEISRDTPAVLEIVGLENKAENFPDELSAGEKQRAAIARALIHRPRVILADEPTGNLDPYNTSDIIKLLLKINQMGTTVILATHNRGVVNMIKKRVITLENGRVIRDDKKGSFIL